MPISDETLDLSPARLPIKLKSGNTFQLRLVLRNKVTKAPVVLTGTMIQIFILESEGGTLVDTLAAGNGVAASDLANGEIKVFWQTAGKLQPRREYPYSLTVTFLPSGRIRTYIEDLIETT